MSSSHMIRFGPFALDALNACLWQGERSLALWPKDFAVLHYLVTHAERLVTKDEILAAVWPETFVSDGVLKGCIRRIRRVLGDDPRAPQCIQTVHRRGYWFIAPVTVADTPLPISFPTTEEPRRAPLPAPPTPATTAPPTEPAPNEEYKVVTILCCAVTDAPVLAVHHGPEAMHRLMQTFFAMAQEALRHYDGTITHITAEGFTAVFGAPVGQEDHARCAVLAALELAHRLRVRLGP